MYKRQLQCTLKGYAPCHNTEEVLVATGYDSERDTLHPTGSVFCAHGAGFLVPWYEVKEYMHLPSIMQEKPSDSSEEKQTAYRVPEETDAWIDTEEVDRIIAQSVGANKKQKTLDVYKRQILFCFVICTSMAILNISRIFIVDHKIMTWGYMGICVVSILYFVLILLLGIERTCIPYISITTIGLIVLVSSTAFTYHVIILLTFPIVVASMYDEMRLRKYACLLYTSRCV